MKMSFPMKISITSNCKYSLFFLVTLLFMFSYHILTWKEFKHRLKMYLQSLLCFFQLRKALLIVSVCFLFPFLFPSFNSII